MDLKFTFAEPKTQPAANNDPLGIVENLSNQLKITVTYDDTAITAIAHTSNAVEYATQSKKVAALNSAATTELATAHRSVLARVVAELGDKLSPSITEVTVSTAALNALKSAEFLTAQHTATPLFTLKTGLAAGTSFSAG